MYQVKPPTEIIDFEGIPCSPGRDGKYRCPYNCGNPDYPEKSWKSVQGFRRHITLCPNKPSAVADRDAHRIKEQKKKELDIAHLLEHCTTKVGDRIFFVREIIIKPTHEMNPWGRLVKVRYEPVKSFRAEEAIVSAIASDGFAVYFNGNIPERSLCCSMNVAEKKAKADQESWEYHCRESSDYR